MTYAMLEEVLIWFWVVWLGALAGFMVWALWVWLIDEPRKRRRISARLAQVCPPAAGRIPDGSGPVPRGTVANRP
jgi:hypothetical protein